MAYQNNVFMLLAIVFVLSNAATSMRDFPIAAKPGVDLAARLQQGHNTTTTDDCWTSLSELRSCSNEIIGFLLNGHTDIDTSCCHAIEVIIHHCWPSMLSVLGFTAEEGTLLAGYCEKSSDPAVALPVCAQNLI